VAAPKVRQGRQEEATKRTRGNDEGDYEDNVGKMIATPANGQGEREDDDQGMVY
jgi:hypothetical protein